MKLLLPFFLAIGMASSAQAQVIDVAQPIVELPIAFFNQGNLVQSFEPTQANCSGATFKLHYYGTGGTITVELWDGNPASGGTMITSGSAWAYPDEWVTVFWPPVPVTANAGPEAYFLNVSCTDLDMAISGDTRDPYPGGFCYTGGGAHPFPWFDYTFFSWFTREQMGLTINGVPDDMNDVMLVSPTPFGQVSLMYAFGTGGQQVWNSFSGTLVTTGLSSNGLTEQGVYTMDANGNHSFQAYVPPAAAGLVHVQALDLTTNKVSNVVAL